MAHRNRTTWLLVAQLIAVAVTYLLPASAWAATGSARGNVFAFREDTYMAGANGTGPAVANRQVNLIHCTLAVSGSCFQFGFTTATTDKNGFFQTNTVTSPSLRGLLVWCHCPALDLPSSSPPFAHGRPANTCRCWLI